MNTNSPFLWKEKPSILSTDPDFNGLNHGKSITAIKNVKYSPISLPGGSKHLRPQTMKKPK